MFMIKFFAFLFFSEFAMDATTVTRVNSLDNVRVGDVVECSMCFHSQTWATHAPEMWNDTVYGCASATGTVIELKWINYPGVACAVQAAVVRCHHGTETLVLDPEEDGHLDVMIHEAPRQSAHI